MKKLFLALLLAPALAFAGSATVTWTNPTSNTDGSAIAASGPGSLTQTRVEYGTCVGGAFGNVSGEVVVPAPAQTVTIPSLSPTVTYCFRAFSRNTYGQESAASNVASRMIPAPVPNPPVVTTVAAVVYDLRIKAGRYVLNAPVGMVPAGTTCGDEVVEGYRAVSEDDVTFTSRPRKTPLVVVCS